MLLNASDKFYASSINHLTATNFLDYSFWCTYVSLTRGNANRYLVYKINDCDKFENCWPLLFCQTEIICFKYRVTKKHRLLWNTQVVQIQLQHNAMAFTPMTKMLCADFYVLKGVKCFEQNTNVHTFWAVNHLFRTEQYKVPSVFLPCIIWWFFHLRDCLVAKYNCAMPVGLEVHSYIVFQGFLMEVFHSCSHTGNWHFLQKSFVSKYVCTASMHDTWL